MARTFGDLRTYVSAISGCSAVFAVSLLTAYCSLLTNPHYGAWRIERAFPLRILR